MILALLSLCFVLAVVSPLRAADVSIAECGAKRDGSKCTLAIAEAVDRCAASGGGRVVVPSGTWLTGRVQLADNVELHLCEGATLEFSDDPSDYLPPVRTSWEGIECINVSPLVSAFGATNIAICGKGTLKARTDGWDRWRIRGPKQSAAQMQLMAWGAKDTPLEERDLTRLDESHNRPPFIGFNRCNGVRLEGFALRESPFWCIHMFHCRDVVLRRLDISAHGSNTDGANFESTRDVLVEDCAFDQGDDVICCKSGRDRDGRRRGVPTENVLVRRCTAKSGHGLFTMGSELSGGIRNVTMEDCTVTGGLSTLFNLKTRPTRGGFVENVTFRRIRANDVFEAVVNISTRNEQWAHLEKGLDRVLTRISGIRIEDVHVRQAKRIVNARGEADCPVRNLAVRSVSAEIALEPDVVENVCMDREWSMFERRLGMFVHWGIYSVGEWHEQEQWRRRMSRADYAKFAERFKAEKFNADDFVDVAKSAGADYIVFTSKHHDGFCMWDTATTDYKVTNTPARRDIVGELADACRRGGIKLGLYYSNPDWHHPNAYNAKSSHQIPPEPGDAPDMEKYVAYVKAQVTELLTKYGEIVCFFWDIPPKIDRPEMDALVRRLQPGIKVNDRGWGNRATSDYSTPERNYKWDSIKGHGVEACDAVGVQSWGYRMDEDYHTHGYLTRRIDKFLSTGANFLLNVGPRADGTIPDEVRAIMAGVGRWHGKVRDSFRDVQTLADLKLESAPDAVVTRRDDTLFVHFPSGLDATGLDLRPLPAAPEKVTLLNTGEALNARVELMPRNTGSFRRETLHVWGIPADELANECIVLRLDFAPGALEGKLMNRKGEAGR